MPIVFTPAAKSQRRLRLALVGPAGSGKTLTSLLFAKAISATGKIALLDTERGSAALYTDRFAFDSFRLDTYRPQLYVEAIEAAAEAGYEVLIVDSLSHAWDGPGGVLEQVKAAGQGPNKSSFTDGWGDVGTPLQNQLIAALTGAPLDVIVTMRAKTEYSMEVNPRTGKTGPKKVGTKAVQRDNVDYEFDIVAAMEVVGPARVQLSIRKSRMPGLSGQTFQNPGKELGGQIKEWLHGTAEPEPQTVRPAVPDRGMQTPTPPTESEKEPETAPEPAVGEEPAGQVKLDIECVARHWAADKELAAAQQVILEKRHGTYDLVDIPPSALHEMAEQFRAKDARLAAEAAAAVPKTESPGG